MGQSALETNSGSNSGKRSVVSRPRQPSVLIIIFLGLILQFVSPPSFAQGAATLGSIEQKLFFKTYAEESDEARLSRLETHLFGQAMQGTFQDRLSRVVGAASPQTNPDGSVSGLGSQQSTTSSSTAPSAADLKARAEEERQDAMERAKIAVAAARDEQTNKLIETGVTLWRSKRGSEALQYFEQALKVDPHNAGALYYAGIVYESKKNFPEALSAYRKASNEDPGNQEYADAVVAVQKLMNNRPPVDPKQAEIRKLATEAGDAYKRGEYLSALDLYKQLDQKAPNQALVKYNLGMLYLQARHFQTALENFHMAVQLRPTDQKFVSAYQQLKASLDKSEAAEQESAAAWAGNPAMNGGGQGMNPGMNQAGNGIPGGNGQMQGRKPYGHAAMNLAAQGVVSPGSGMQQGNQGQGYSNNSMNGGSNNGMNAGMNNSMNGGSNNGMNAGMNNSMNGGGNNGMNAGMNNSMNGGGNNGLNTVMNSGNNSNNGMGQSNLMQGGSQVDNTSASGQMQQNAPPKSVAVQPGKGQAPGFAPSDSASNGSAALQRWANVQNNAKAGSDLSEIPAGQRPLVHHPLHSANKPASSSSPAIASNSGVPFQPEKNINFNKLEQPVANAMSDLGLVATNSKSGVMITHVGIASRASKAGLLKGDIIRAVDNKVVTSLTQVMSLVTKKGPSAPIDLHIQRKDQMGVVHL